MADWTDRNFKWQYDYSKAHVANSSSFAEEWGPVMALLKRLLGDSGFVAAEARALDMVRKQALKDGDKIVSMGDGLLAAAKAGGNNAPTLPSEAKLRASALKFLAHTYLVGYSSNRSMWVHSSPKAFDDWPSVHMNSWANTRLEVKRLLNSRNEQFSLADKKNIATCATRALAWIHKTNLVLGHSSSRTAEGKASWARSVVKRWFADPASTDADVDGYIDILAKGFKQITAMLNKGTMILTDHMGLRLASTANELKFHNAEAFTFRGQWEGLDVVYIEKAFFTQNPGNVLPGEANWSRILIHELTHLCANTIDVVNGKARYAWYGIGPHAGYPGSQCITNADNWAFFATDCGGGITDDQRAKALKII